MSVVAFPRPADRVWVCNCGCMSFFLHGDGEPRCTSCDALVSCDLGGWHERVVAGKDWTGEAPEWQSRGDLSLVKGVTLRRAQEGDVALLLVVKKSGARHLFSDLDGEEQVAWAVRMLDAGKEML
jgi:hypothetical protein